MDKHHTSYLHEYLYYESFRGHTKQGLDSFKSALRSFFCYLEETALAVEHVQAKQAFEYQGWLLGRRKDDGTCYAAKTICHRLVAACSFYEYLKHENIAATNPFKEIQRVKPDKTLPKDILKEKEMVGFLDKLARWEEETAGQNRITRYKVHVIAELMYATGMRISEIAALKVSDVDLVRGMVKVHGKGNRERYAFLSEYAKEILRLFLVRMRSLVFNEYNQQNSDLVFGTKRMGLNDVVNRMLTKTAKACGHSHFSSHGFRHAVGYHLLRAGCSIRYIQQLLGHKSLKSTEIYTKVDKESLKKVIDQFHPRKWRPQ